MVLKLLQPTSYKIIDVGFRMFWNTSLGGPYVPLCWCEVQASPRAYSQRGVLSISTPREWVAQFLPYQPQEIQEGMVLTWLKMHEWISCLIPLASWILGDWKTKCFFSWELLLHQRCNFLHFMGTIPFARYNWSHIALKTTSYVSLHNIIAIKDRGIYVCFSYWFNGLLHYIHSTRGFLFLVLYSFTTPGYGIFFSLRIFIHSYCCSLYS